MAEVGPRIGVQHHDSVVDTCPAESLVGHHGLQSTLYGRLGQVDIHVSLGDPPESTTFSVRREEDIGALDVADKRVSSLRPADLSRAGRQRGCHVVRDVPLHVWVHDNAQRNVYALEKEAKYGILIHFPGKNKRFTNQGFTNQPRNVYNTKLAI